ncbi:transcriptional regulator [Hahella sp. CCB-MM4]|uniref:LysR family transcriptional regulator n=1 Tax=Hahella sp. (strain CCB-MM4) TaxID=1926491 RepID=UPI000B9B9E87|nr:LysR family transcriptional regulator [Hahella sp. CCB-MM4]OZG73667.1 transcriptional regulator [Hahella sp. CCB-MM4]
MDLIDLKTFIKIAETGSFSAAAEQLHVTQPAVSKRLANLEQTFATPLIERLPRNARLTEAGKLLKTRAEHIIREVENTQALIQNLHENVGGTLSIATSHHIGLHRLPEQIRRFVKDYPEVDFDLRFLASEDAEQAVLNGDVELALMTLPETQNPLMEYHTLWHDDLIFVASKEHPLSTLDTPELKDLTKYRAILPAANTITFQKISTIFQRHQLQLRPSIPTNYLETIKMMVSVGLGWSVLPESMLDSSLQLLKIGQPLRRELGVIHDTRRMLSRAANAFLKQLEH